MIVFNLACGNDHPFEGWFSSAADFEQQQQATLLSCPVCGSQKVTKTVHAPYVNTGNVARPAERTAKGGAEQYANVGGELAQLIEHLIANSDDVGDAFPEEARKIYYQEAPERRIRGNASHDDVKDLREEGIDIIALPVPKYRLGKTH